MTTKPTVHYAHGQVELHILDTGNGMFARLYAVDHPHLGEGDVRTSRIVSINAQTGEIETLNTRYIPTPV